MSDEEGDVHWRQGANLIINDLKNHVQDISIADLPCTDDKLFFNLTTLEMKEFCLELSPEGFRIVGEKYNSEDQRGKYSVYETPYSMLDSLSPAYRASFGEQLMNKLNQLQEEQTNKDEEGSVK